MVNDLAIFKSNHPSLVDSMNQGISPFTLEKLTAKEEYEVNDQEESMEQATHITMTDVAKNREKEPNSQFWTHHTSLKLWQHSELSFSYCLVPCHHYS